MIEDWKGERPLDDTEREFNEQVGLSSCTELDAVPGSCILGTQNWRYAPTEDGFNGQQMNI